MKSYRYCARSAVFVSAALLIGSPVSAQAAVLKINDNVINLSGELSASVKHTAEGMEIEIPGVEITLDCDTAADPDNCTVTIGSGTSSSGSGTGSSSSGTGSSGSGTGSSGSGTGSSGSGTGSSGSGSSSSSSDSDSDSDGNAECNPALDFGCGASYGSGDDSSSGSDGSDASGSGSSTGYTSGTTSSGSDADDPCSGTGYNPNCNSTTSTSTQAQGAFPIGGDRKVENLSGSFNYGSANPSGKARITVPSGTVTVLGLVMKSGDSPSNGSISFAQASNISGVALRAWISTAPDGGHVGACSYSGYAEGVLPFSIGGTSGCNLSAGTTYYFNMALCSSTANDLYCNQSGALAHPVGGIIVVNSSYTD